jgi:flagellar motor switch protein FliG
MDKVFLNLIEWDLNKEESKVAGTEKIKSITKKMKKKTEAQFILQLNSGDIPTWKETIKEPTKEASNETIATVETIIRSAPSRATAIGSPTKELSPSNSAQKTQTTQGNKAQPYINELDKLLSQLPQQQAPTTEKTEINQAVEVLDDLTNLLNASVLYNK